MLKSTATTMAAGTAECRAWEFVSWHVVIAATGLSPLSPEAFRL